MKIGLDFDNTIVAYDQVFRSVAIERGLIGDTICAEKRAIRDRIRLLPDGELSWQRLQGYVYGMGIAQATMFDGVDSFLRRCGREGCSVVIVSHKTEFGHHDSARTSLRRAAVDWMTEHGFFGAQGYAIPVENVYFEGTRSEKLARISALGCTHFIDDLAEVLEDPGFPESVTRILFSPGETGDSALPYVVCRTWRDVEERVFGDPP
jgi:hypothetical protein